MSSRNIYKIYLSEKINARGKTKLKERPQKMSRKDNLMGKMRAKPFI